MSLGRKRSSRSPITSLVPPRLQIRLSQGFDAAAAAGEMLEHGVTLVDDIAEQLYDVCRDEVIEELGHAADEMDVQVTRVTTSIGPVFIFRDRNRVPLAEAKRLVFASRSRAAGVARALPRG